jgi:hypothetical protein
MTNITLELLYINNTKVYYNPVYLFHLFWQKHNHVNYDNINKEPKIYFLQMKTQLSLLSYW